MCESFVVSRGHPTKISVLMYSFALYRGGFHSDKKANSIYSTKYTVSQKTSKIIFVITTSNFHQIWQLLAQRWQIV